MNRNLRQGFFLPGLILLCTTLNAQKDTVKQKGKYESLFKGKKVETKKGIVTLLKMSGKVYLEFPVNLFRKAFFTGVGCRTNQPYGKGGCRGTGKRPVCSTFNADR